jgi:DNA-binding LytR/AlgR family response regulator
MPIDCIILEDEPLAMEKMCDFVAKMPALELVKTFHSSVEALLYLKENPVTLLFLDIEMEEMTGLQVIAALKQLPYIIITSAYEKYALKGYELNVTDYLLKPFDFSRFLKAIEKVQEQIGKKVPEGRDYFFVQSEYRSVKIFYKDVLYIEGKRDYRCIHTEKEKIMTLQTFTELETMLRPDKLCRIHKSFMVAIDNVAFVERGQVKIKDQLLPVSETYRQKFYALLGIA